MLPCTDHIIKPLRGCWHGYVAPWAIGVALASVIAHPILAQSNKNEALIDFSISPQPLASALSRYGDATGNEALYEGGLTEGRISGNVQGRLTPDEALQRLLAGTGLAARLVAEGTFVLAPASRPRSVQAIASAHQHFYAVVQESAIDALCRMREVRPGNYRLLAVFWIAKNGAVEDFLRVGTSGKVAADQLIDKTLRGLKFREAPPADFLQPVRILFVPEGPGVNSGCAIVDARIQAQGGVR